MEVKIKTEELQGMVGRVIKGVGDNKLIPISSQMSVAVKNKSLCLASTDGSNFYYVYSKSEVDCDDFEVCVRDAELFANLVQKTTAENTTIIFEDGVLKVTGNGTYILELPPEDDNGPIKFPKVIVEKEREELGIMTMDDVENIISVNKASIMLEGTQFPALRCYYCGNEVLTSDRKVACLNSLSLFDTPILISLPVMNLLSSVSSDKIKVLKSDTDLLFETEDECIYAPIQEDISEYPVSGIEKFIDGEFPSVCKVSRMDLLNLLERLSLFVDAYDKKGINIVIDEKGLLLSSKKSSGKEFIPYSDSEGHSPFSCCINVKMLKSQLMSMKSDIISLYYGSDIAIKLEEEGVSLVVGLFDESKE